MAQTKLKISTGKKTGSKIMEKSVTGMEKAIEMVDSLVHQNSKIATLKAELAELEKPFKSELETFIDYVELDKDIEDKVDVSNGKHVITLSPRLQTRVLDDDKKDDLIMAMEDIKEGLALEGATWQMKFLQAYLPEAVLDKFFNKKIGNRRVTFK